MNEILVAILSGGVVVAVIEGIREALKWRRTRKAVKEDRAEKKAEDAKRTAELKTEERLGAIEEPKNDQPMYVPRRASSALPRSSLEMQNPGPHT